MKSINCRRISTCILALLLASAAWGVPEHGRWVTATAPSDRSGGLSAAEFSQLIQEFSEPDGYFRSDNFTSNETSYLHVVSRLRELGVSGGAYIGVGPEQNFTYIAKIRPRIAFVVDIRRQAIIQHLMYKAIFRQAETRAQFLSLLFSRPLPRDKPDLNNRPVSELLDFFRTATPPDDVFARNLARIQKIIREEFRFPLSEKDQSQLEYVYKSFRTQGVGISFQFGSRQWPGYSGWFPTFSDLVLQTDQEGRLGSFLANDEDYRFVRNLQMQNRIIPVVGDFAGQKALTSVARYLTRNGYKVSAFYTSNVEQFLFQSGVFTSFVANVQKFPIDDKSVFIRAVARLGMEHPAHVAGHFTTTLLQKITVFLHDQDQSPYETYWDLVMTHYIAGEQ